jgi:4-carboxymuconolactone decarboxylase
MADAQRRARGEKKFNEVYCGDLPAPAAGQMAFFDIMIEQLFGEVWTREALPLRDRRLLTMGVLAALGEKDPFCIQVRSGLKNGEFSAEQVREMLVHLAPYAGYPRAAGLLGATETVLREFEKQSAPRG